jgi:hypothetical protein
MGIRGRTSRQILVHTRMLVVRRISRCYLHQEELLE